MSSQIRDLDFATHRLIIEHGLRIGNTGAPCIVEADSTLQALSQEIGEELMEISGIASKDFLRIPNEFVHPYIEKTERESKGYLSEVMTGLSNGNAVTNIQGIIEQLEVQQDAARTLLSNVHEEIEAEIEYKRRQMNYVKAEIFPILESSLRYYRRGTEAIIASLSTCN